MQAFPVMCPGWDKRYKDLINCPKSVPWDFVLPHDAQCRQNHDAGLRRLAERGGLCPIELVAVLENREYTPIPAQDAVDKINSLLETYAST